MRYTELPQERILARINRGLEFRPSGVHVSDIIRDIENTVTKKGQRKGVAELTEDEKNRMGVYTSMGWAWELIIRPALRDVYFAGDDRFTVVGPVPCDGIIGTPDGFDCDDYCLEEFKATWRSSRRDIVDDFWSWQVQMKAYCYMLGTQTARLRVFFVNGDYRESGPQIKMWEFLYDDEELRQNWTMLVNHAKGKGWLK